MHATGRRTAHFVLACLIAGALATAAGCGQTGALYLPDDPEPVPVEENGDDDEQPDDELQQARP